MRLSLRGSLLAAFFVTGVTALILEVVWTRMLLLVVGTTPAAMGIVLAAFMGGMALGSWGVGLPIGARASVVWYAGLEAWVGAYALISPALLPLVGRLIPPLQIPVAVAALLPATLAMGASLPVLTAVLERDAESTGARVGVLYAANTAGAFCGPLIAVFWLFPAVGLQRTLVVAAIVNLVVAGAVVALRRRMASEPFSAPASSPAAGEGACAGGVGPAVRLDRLALVAVAVSGAGAMVDEIAWSRTLSMIYGSSVYGVSIMLSTFLLGIAAGAWAAARVLRRRRAAPGPVALAWLLVGAGGLAFASLLVARYLPFVFLDLLRAAPTPRPALVFTGQFAMAALLMLPATVCLGAMLPVAAAQPSHRGAPGAVVARLYAGNLLGSAAGAALAAAVLLSALGVERSVRVAAVAAAATGLIIVLRNRHVHLAAATAAVGVMALALTVDGTGGRLAQSFGLYAAAPSYFPYDAAGMRRVLAVHQLLYYRDGAAATVAVQQVDRYRLLKINGKTDASNGAGDVETQTLVGHLPLMAAASRAELQDPGGPEKVAIVGWGSGMTVAAVLTHPVESVDVFEIEPAVVEASRHFEEDVGRPLDDPRVRLILGDARGEIARRRARYDVVISEPSNPWITGVANLFTREFFELVASRLTPNGVACQWFHTYGMSEDAVRSLIATFRAVFPHAVAFKDRDLILIGSRQPIRFSLRKLDERFRRADVRASLARAFVTYPADLLVKLRLDDQGTAAFAGGAPLNTDDNMRIELAAPRTLYEDRLEPIRAAIAQHPPVPLTLLTEYGSEAEAALELAASFFTGGLHEEALRHCERALALEPSFAGLKLLGQIAQRAGDVARARNAWQLALAMGGDPAGRAFVQGLLRALDYPAGS